ncbi:hypothetical protein QSJ19_26545 [Gordonia sp. ABSL11-1]|uniref:hypothetical protein n=1 Tax=Gordonia sp. ABSL11-1 TaxID=3053924 RepID=UPI0025747581|nr:hypothetical protein [Gordonia sp. ABSL11-1]MDL9949068.1 hypothetical protein [Gordonia sp. ABSL11-1]
MAPNAMTPLLSALLAPTDRQADLAMLLIRNGANVRVKLSTGKSYSELAEGIAGDELRAELHQIGLLTD